MKYLLITLLLGLASPLSAEKATANDFFKAGEAALKKGDVKTAEASYRKALRLDPNHGNSRFRLADMKNLKPEARVRVRRGKMKSIILPDVTFEEEPLEDCLTALGAKIEAVDGTFIPNFLISDPNDLITKKEISIRLRNIPATEALKYILSQAKATAKWDAHVITVSPLASGKASSAITKATEKTTETSKSK